MNRTEAQTILRQELAAYRNRQYQELLRLLETQDVKEIRGPSGVMYQLEFQAFWDDCVSGPLRVIGAIDDGGLRAFLPLTEDFIIGPDGGFIGE